MSTRTVLLPSLPLAATPEYDYVLSADAQTVHSHGRAAADLLPTADHTVAVVPAHALSWHRVALPAALYRSVLSARTDAARVRAILSGVLEEALLDEPEQLHFACFADQGHATADTSLASAASTDTLWVAVCDRAWLRTVLQPLEASGATVGRIVAECAPVASDDQAYRLVTPDWEPARLVVCTPQAVVTLPLHAGTALSKVWSGTPDSPVMAEPAVAAQCEQLLGCTAQVLTRAQRLLQVSQSPWNLAQRDFSTSAANRWRKLGADALQSWLHAPQWRLARWSVVALLVINLAALNALAWREKQSLADQQAALRSVLQETFPEVGLIIDAPAQMQRQLQVLAQSRGMAGALHTAAALGALSTALSSPSTAPTSLELSGDSLLIGGLDLPAQAAASVQQQLLAQGWTLQAQGPQWQLRRREAP